MGESLKHKELIDIIYEYSKSLIPDNHDKLITMDGNENLLKKSVPPMIKGVRPDLYYEFGKTLIVGEAKTENDYNTKHSLSQYNKYMEYCNCYDGKSYIVMACPWTCSPDLKSCLKNIKNKNGYDVEIVVLDEVSGDKKVQNMQKMKLSKEPSYRAKYEAFSYQKQAVDSVKDLEYAAIFHEQGLGKTKIAIDILLYWLDNKMLDVVLIVTKKQLVSNWFAEIKEHTNLTPGILTSNKSENYYIFNGRSRVILANFEVINSELKRFQSYLKLLNVGIIVDESAKLKNPTSKLTQNYFTLKDLFKKRIIMTGTPIANRPYDIWSQIYFLDGGKSLGDNFDDFKKETDLSNELYKNENKAALFEEKVASIYKAISSFSVRETKSSGIINLPNKVYKNVYVPFEDEQFELYEKIRLEMMALVEKNEKTFVDDSSTSLKRLLRLVQAASNPKLIDDLYFGVSGKEKELDTLINEIIERGEKCIIWSSFIENIDYFHTKYFNVGSVKIHGKMSIESRVKSVDKFKNNPDVRLLFATPQAAKEGLTLTVANNVIFYDRGFSLDDYLQAQDRIHRISQTKECNIYNLIVENSIDEWVDVLLNAKEKAAKLGQGDVTLDDYKNSVSYSFGEMIKDILGGVEND